MPASCSVVVADRLGRDQAALQLDTSKNLGIFHAL
jgi:hypothetical protein